MIIDIKSLLLLFGILAASLLLKLMWELILLVKGARQSLTTLDYTMKVYQSLASKTSETLEEVDILLGDAQGVADDYRVMKGEVFSLGAKAGEVARQMMSQFLK